MELKECVEQVKELQDQCQWPMRMLPKEKLRGKAKGLIEYYDRAERNIEALQTLITLAQTVLQVSEAEGMPKRMDYDNHSIHASFRLDGNKTKEGLEKIEVHGECRGFNSALDLCTAYIAGKLEGVKAICIYELWHPDLFDDLKIDPLDMNARTALKATASIIATAIRASFGVKGKE